MALHGGVRGSSWVWEQPLTRPRSAATLFRKGRGQTRLPTEMIAHGPTFRAREVVLQLLFQWDQNPTPVPRKAVTRFVRDRFACGCRHGSVQPRAAGWRCGP